ncbi:hypothetical protein FQN54_000636 [Arachnomyces sp. PD_36]|nr:hypothetical protein FQN54_000636 [Arachnomyces sp. PD_36]
MVDRGDKSQVKKRGRVSVGNDVQDLKKPRRSQRISSQLGPESGNNAYLPTPLTHQDSTETELPTEQTVTPETRPSQYRDVQRFSSPPGDTQAFSQFIYPPRTLANELEDEVEDGVWGYLIPLDNRFGDELVLRKRDSCNSPALGTLGSKTSKSSKGKGKAAVNLAKNKYQEEHPGGYLIGRHPECDFVLDIPTISNRHCLIFHENRRGDSVAILEDLSSNGTFVNEGIVGRNKRRDLEDGDEITILDEARFVFRYPKTRDTNGFRQQYRIIQKLGKGHFASVYLCVERSTGIKYAVKIFERRPSESQRSETDGLKQEIAVLMSVNHPNVLCLKDTFDESDGVYLVLELAPEGELFNWIVANQKLTEAESRKVFVQLLEGLKYLHERNIVHRDIKPENILLIDKHLSVKLADFGLAKIIGEDSFTTTLCGTPSYVAPEILESTKHRRYTRAVDVWSLGVVLYICLCGFPPFSDELYARDYPYTLSEQIKKGQFNYPSPYWDSVGDPALDLIDRMLTVDFDKRITIDECLEHPWVTGKLPSLADSTDGLTGAMGQLDFSRRKVKRERTLLSSINDVKVSQVIEDEDDTQNSHVKVFNNNVAGKRVHNRPAQRVVKKGGRGGEPGPSDNRGAGDFMRVGGGDPVLYEDDVGPSTRGRKRY